ncbi:MAG: hypothetical protein R3B99_37410 [Polyangiales bacterium]
MASHTIEAAARLDDGWLFLASDGALSFARTPTSDLVPVGHTSLRATASAQRGALVVHDDHEYEVWPGPRERGTSSRAIRHARSLESGLEVTRGDAVERGTSFASLRFAHTRPDGPSRDDDDTCVERVLSRSQPAIRDAWARRGFPARGVGIRTSDGVMAWVYEGQFLERAVNGLVRARPWSGPTHCSVRSRAHGDAWIVSCRDGTRNRELGADPLFDFYVRRGESVAPLGRGPMLHGGQGWRGRCDGRPDEHVGCAVTDSGRLREVPLEERFTTVAVCGENVSHGEGRFAGPDARAHFGGSVLRCGPRDRLVREEGEWLDPQPLRLGDDRRLLPVAHGQHHGWTFAPNGRGLALGRQSVALTVDGGLTWQIHAQPLGGHVASAFCFDEDCLLFAESGASLGRASALVRCATGPHASHVPCSAP